MKRITSLALSAALLASLSTPVLAAPAISLWMQPLRQLYWNRKTLCGSFRRQIRRT